MSSADNNDTETFTAEKQKTKKHQDFNTTYSEETANVEKDAPIRRDELNLLVVMLNIMQASSYWGLRVNQNVNGAKFIEN